ncbi:MAG: hypothetical protein QXP31_00650 [Pyrobaculum sp.]
MPLTPLHLGPALYLGVLFRGRLHLPTLLVASVAVDVEPLLVFLLGLDAPLHGPLHTFVGAAAVGAAVALAMYFLDPRLYFLYRLFRLGAGGFLKPTLSSHLASGVLGAASHVLLDAPLYSEMQPLYPVAGNPFDLGCGKVGMATMWLICVFLGGAGLVGYLRHVFGRPVALASATLGIAPYYFLVFWGSGLWPFLALAAGVAAVNTWLIFRPSERLALASVALASSGVMWMALVADYPANCVGLASAVVALALLLSVASAQVFAAGPVRISLTRIGWPGRWA